VQDGAVWASAPAPVPPWLRRCGLMAAFHVSAAVAAAAAALVPAQKADWSQLQSAPDSQQQQSLRVTCREALAAAAAHSFVQLSNQLSAGISLVRGWCGGECAVPCFLAGAMCVSLAHQWVTAVCHNQPHNDRITQPTWALISFSTHTTFGYRLLGCEGCASRWHTAAMSLPSPRFCRPASRLTPCQPL
jgi:hypothetical protein